MKICNGDDHLRLPDVFLEPPYQFGLQLLLRHAGRVHLSHQGQVDVAIRVYAKRFLIDLFGIGADQNLIVGIQHIVGTKLAGIRW